MVVKFPLCKRKAAQPTAFPANPRLEHEVCLSPQQYVNLFLFIYGGSPETRGYGMQLFKGQKEKLV